MSQSVLDRIVALSKLEARADGAEPTAQSQRIMAAASILRRLGGQDNGPARVVAICKSLESLSDEDQVAVLAACEAIANPAPALVA